MNYFVLFLISFLLNLHLFLLVHRTLYILMAQSFIYQLSCKYYLSVSFTFQFVHDVLITFKTSNLFISDFCLGKALRICIKCLYKTLNVCFFLYWIKVALLFTFEYVILCQVYSNKKRSKNNKIKRKTLLKVGIHFQY